MTDIIYIDASKEEVIKTYKQWQEDNPLLYTKYKTECIVCGTKENLQLHHKDGDKRHNNKGNIECLCSKCHFNLHQIEFQVRYTKQYIPEVDEGKKDIPMHPVVVKCGKGKCTVCEKKDTLHTFFEDKLCRNCIGALRHLYGKDFENYTRKWWHKFITKK